ncbi:hypothetical protein [uncultured Dubosiella sp.]|uniref:hypothetical protein n=1 Tax=uncultured Dubosiella sp. TaxID=1937011 RepID=UPI00207DBF30|nr:hypothetical protein [uncultured Dubosiella sp.]GJM59319.1 hypothetical protein EROP_30120 [Erysipelotrichaceae bacterium OPF54]
MEFLVSEKIIFDSVTFDLLNKTFEILDGSIGVYRYEDIKRFAILNENARYRGKQTPFTALLPGSGLPAGIFSYPYMYVGIKVVLKDETILGIYVSKEKTMLNTDQYIHDRKIANEISQVFQDIVNNYASLNEDNPEK